MMEKRLRQHVEALASSPRVPGTSEHDKARRYLCEQLETATFECHESMHEVEGQRCVNLVTTPYPQTMNGPHVILAAHYDTVVGSPGADDNASALAVLIEVARSVGPTLAITRTAQLQIVAYDHEETGMLGSTAHANQLARENVEIKGMIALEMLGFASEEPGSQRLPPELAGLYPDVGNFIAIVGNQNSVELVQQVTESMQSIPDLPVESLAVPEGSPLQREAERSDHAPFWAQGMPALMITDTSNFRNPHYHQSSDTPETLNYPFLTKVAQGVRQAVLRLVSGP